MRQVVRRAVFVALMAVLAVYAFGQLRGPQGLAALLEKREAIRKLELENRKMEAENARLRQYNADLRDKKPEVIEPLIRERTNMLREHEKDFRHPAQPQSGR